MPHNRKSAADQVAEAKAKAAGIPYVKRTLEDLEDGKVYNAPNKPTEPPKKREASEAQKAANKANAQNFTGPPTPEGKAKVSTNAIRHGLCSARNPVDIATAIPGEQTQFESILTGFTARFQPNDEVELHLVQRLAQLTLRLNRAAQMETALIDQAHTSATEWIEDRPSYFPDPTQHPTEILAGTWTRSAKEAILLSQYESRLSHDFARTLRQLLQLQNLRKQTQSVLSPKEGPRPQHTGTDDTVPSGLDETLSRSDCRPRVESAVCPPNNLQSPNEPHSSPEIFAKQTQPTPPTRSLTSDHPTDPQPLLNFDQTNPSLASNGPTPPRLPAERTHRNGIHSYR